MAISSRRGFLALLAGAVTLHAGCGDLGSMAYFLMPEQRIDAKIKHLAAKKDDKKVPRVVILSWMGMETRHQLIHADRQLNELLAQHLREQAEAFEEKLHIVPARKVEEFKNDNPNWRAMDLARVGKRFEADYVIYLEINEMSLFEKGPSNHLFRGRAYVTLSLVDVNKPDDTPAQETFSSIYPAEAPIPVGGDGELAQFRQLFLNRVAKQLSWYFSKYPRRERHLMDSTPASGVGGW